MIRFLKWLFGRRPARKPMIYRLAVADEINTAWLVRCLMDTNKARRLVRIRRIPNARRLPALFF